MRVYIFISIKLSQTIKYLEFLSLTDAKTHYKSKFDYEPSFGTDSSGGDIVYKILGIESNDEMTRVPSILISKKTRCDQDTDTIEEEPPNAFDTPDEMGNIRNLLQQEELRDIAPSSAPTLRDKMKRIRASSKNLLNKKVTQVKLMSSSGKNYNEPGDVALHESQSDISLYKPVVSLRESAAELGSNILRKVKRSQRPRRQSNDGVGMATLLVRSMMAAPSLDSIAENADVATAAGPLKPTIDANDSGSMISLPTKKHHHPHIENKLNISVGDSIIDLKASDGNLSSGVSMSSATMSESSSDDDEILGDEVVMIDADTISM